MDRLLIVSVLRPVTCLVSDGYSWPFFFSHGWTCFNALFLLIYWDFHATHFFFITLTPTSLFNSPKIHDTSLTPPTSYPLLLKKYLIESKLFCPYTSGCGVTYLRVVDLPGSTPSHKTDSSFPGNHQVFILLQLWIGLVSPFFVCVGMLTDLVLCSQPQVLWMHECSSLIPRRYYFALPLPGRWLLQDFHLFLLSGVWAFGRVWYSCSIYG